MRRIMGRLGRVRSGCVGNVLDDDIRLVKVSAQTFVICFYFLDRGLVGLEYPSALHLVENWIVGRVNFVSSINISRQEPLGMACGKSFNFMSRSVSSKHIVLVDIVTVCDGPAGMIGGKAKRVKVLGRGNHRIEGR